MLEQGHDFDAIWQQIEELVVMSLLAVQPLLQLNYRTAFPATNDGFSCFEVLGYDVLLDEKCRPWLLEVCSVPAGSCPCHACISGSSLCCLCHCTVHSLVSLPDILAPSKLCYLNLMCSIAASISACLQLAYNLQHMPRCRH